MRIFCITLLFIAAIAYAPSSAASDYYDRLIRQKQQQAEQKRLSTMKRVHEVQANPDAYFARQNSVHIGKASVERFDIERDGHYYVPVQINSRSLKFMADTGASGIFISQSDARKVGINPQTLQYNQKYTTANGQTGRAAVAIAKRFKVGSIEMRDVPVIVSRENKHIALLGMEFFNRLRRYEFADGEMSLFE